MYRSVFCQAEDAERGAQESRGLGDVYERQVFNRVRSVVRVHRVALHLPFISLSHVVDACKGLVQERIDTQGQESMFTNRKQPLQNGMFASWFSLLSIIHIRRRRRHGYTSLPRLYLYLQ